MNSNVVYAIRDTFHPGINGDATPLITSAMFETPRNFFAWCRQHGAEGQSYPLLGTMNELIEFIWENRPDRWVVSFGSEKELTLEYFGEGYMGDKEVSTGTWEFTGSPKETLLAAAVMIFEELKGSLERREIASE